MSVEIEIQTHSKCGKKTFTKKLSYIRDERLDILETFKEKHEALLKVLQYRLVLVTGDLKRTLEVFHEFRNHLNEMVNNMYQWRVGIFGFSVLAIFFGMVFRFLCQNVGFVDFGVLCGLRIFRCLAFACQKD